MGCCGDHSAQACTSVQQRLEEVEFERSASHAASVGDVDRLRRILEKHPNQLDGGDTGYSPLVYASRAGHVSCVEYLISQGADVNFCTRAMGSTALHRAAVQGHAEVVRKLVQAGCDMGIRDCDGKTAYDKARGAGHEDVCRLLVSHGFSTS